MLVCGQEKIRSKNLTVHEFFQERIKFEKASLDISQWFEFTPGAQSKEECYSGLRIEGTRQSSTGEVVCDHKLPLPDFI